MVTAWDVYWVMQLDSVGKFLGAVSGLCFVAALALSIQFPATLRAAIIFSFWAFLVGLLLALLPSSRTAAAMILVPALTSDEVVQPVAAEAKELCALAKDALKKLGEDKEE